MEEGGDKKLDKNKGLDGREGGVSGGGPDDPAHTFDIPT